MAVIETEVSTMVSLSSAARRSLVWLSSALHGIQQELASDLWLVHLPSDSTLDSSESQRLFLVSSAADSLPPLTAEHPWVQRLMKLADERGPLQARPRRQPQHWNELEPQLLAPYTVLGGEKSIAACTLDERPLLQLTMGRVTDSGQLELENIVYDEVGNALSPQLAAQLGLDDLEIQEQPPVRRLTNDWLRDWVAKSSEQLDSAALGYHLIAATVIWCKHAEGRIALSVNGVRTEVHFSGWAHLVASGTLSPPPFKCIATKISSYQVAITDDGVITAAEAIDVCEHSRARVLCNELAACADTGARVQKRFLEVCPITTEAALPTAFGECQCCRQRVRRTVLENDTCQACRSLEAVRKSDPRLARLLGEYPRLDRWRHWSLAETGTVYVLVAHSFFKRLLLVVHKSSLEPLRIATARRRRGNWNDVRVDDQSQLLGES